MNEILDLLSKECSISEQFKENFSVLQKEYVKLQCENQHLQAEILDLQGKTDQPLLEMKEALKKCQDNLQTKEKAIHQLQSQLEVTQRLLGDRESRECRLLSKIASTELALEQTHSLLGALQSESNTLMARLEESYNTIAHEHELEKQSIIMDLGSKFIKSDQEKKDIARQVLSATKKATKNVRQLKQENSAFQLTIQSLKASVEATSLENTELSSQLATLRAQHSHDENKLLSEIRRLQDECATLRTEKETAQLNQQGAAEEKIRCEALLTLYQNENVQLKSQIEDVELRQRRQLEALHQDAERAADKFNAEKLELLTVNSETKTRLEVELNTIVQLTERLRDAEQRMAAEQQQLRQAETEAVRKVHDVRIRTEDKYRAIVEEKVRAEVATSKKLSELESNLILERSLKDGVEAQLQKKALENEQLVARSRKCDDLQLQISQLEKDLSRKESDRVQMAEELDLCRKRLSEANEAVLKEKNSALEQLDQSRDANRKQQLEAEARINELLTLLHQTRSKSKQYARLIWKLRQRLIGCEMSTSANGKMSDQ